MMQPQNLKTLAPLPEYPYSGLPGQGHPDEYRINHLLSGKSWTEFSGSVRALTKLANELSDELALVTDEAFFLLLPALFLSAIELSEHFTASIATDLEVHLQSRIGQDPEGIMSVFLSIYSLDQIAELFLLNIELHRRMRRELSESICLDFMHQAIGLSKRYQWP